MKQLLIIFLGGGLGSISRFSLGTWINSRYANTFPFGTFTVNVLACFVLGLLLGVADHKQILSAQAKLFWVIGFCGGFSTFSTFSGESLALLQQGNFGTTFIYMGCSLVACLFATYFGMILTRFF